MIFRRAWFREKNSITINVNDRHESWSTKYSTTTFPTFNYAYVAAIPITESNFQEPDFLNSGELDSGLARETILAIISMTVTKADLDLGISGIFPPVELCLRSSCVNWHDLIMFSGSRLPEFWRARFREENIIMFHSGDRHENWSSQYTTTIFPDCRKYHILKWKIIQSNIHISCL